MIVWWILGGGAWTLFIWVTAVTLGVRVFGARTERVAASPAAHPAPSDVDHHFVAYPTDSLFAVIDEPAEAGAVMAELEGAGIGKESVLAFAGDAGAAEIDGDGVNHGLLARAVRIAQAVSMDADQTHRYENEARAGHTVIAVHGAASKAPALNIFKAHHGHFINYYARLHFEAIEP